MATMNVSELTGAALDWVVAMALGIDPSIRQFCDEDLCISWGFRVPEFGDNYQPSTSWGHGGPLLDKFDFDVGRARNITWAKGDFYAVVRGDHMIVTEWGQTRLIAICRALAAYKLGDTVDIPQVLLYGYDN